jgi:hypothetical protein
MPFKKSMTEQPYKIGIIGHRDLGEIENQFYPQLCCHQLLANFKKKYTNVIALSAISAGADSMFAQTAVSLDIRLESIIPFEQFSSDFQDELDLERYTFLRSQSNYDSSANFSERSNQAYRKSMEWLVFKANTIVAIWDGMEIGVIGGTWEAVSLTMKIKKTLIHIDNINKTMNIYINKGDRYLQHQNLSVAQVLDYL